MEKMNDLRRELDNIISRINSDNCDVRYSVYRTALKLCRLQDTFHLQEISSHSMQSCVKKFLSNDKNKIQFITSEAVTFKQLHRLINDVLKISGVQSFPETAKLSKYLTILIFEAFKDVKESKVAVIAVVLFFVCLGPEEIQAKYKVLFTLYSGAVGMLSRSRTGLLLTHLIRITDIVGESGRFGKIMPAVESCFEGVLGAMISLHHLLQWLLREPQSIVWLPTMHRLNLSKSSIHHVECATCKVSPIVGLRFQCLKCLDYDSCQICFLTQQNATRSHKLNHPRQEYCLPAGNKEKVNAFARTIRNIVTKRYKQKSLTSSYLPISQSGSDLNIANPTSGNNPPRPLHQAKTAKSPGKDVLNDSADFEDVNQLADEERGQLEELVMKLKKENEKMSGTVHLLESTHKEKVKIDEDHLVLQSKLDTVTMHNHSLQAELDNLKCVVFADNFLHEGQLYKDPPQENGKPENEDYYEDHSPDASSLHQVVAAENATAPPPNRRSKHKRASERFRNSSSKEQEANDNRTVPKLPASFSSKDDCETPEEQLRDMLEKLGAAMTKNAEPQMAANQPKPNNNRLQLTANHQIFVAAEKVKEEINSLIEQAILL